MPPGGQNHAMPWGGNAYDHAADPSGVLGAYSSEYGLQEVANAANSRERYSMDGGGPQHPYLASESYDSCPETPLVMDHYVGPFVPYPATPFLQQTQLLHFEPRQLLTGDDAAYPPSVPAYVGGEGDCNENTEDRCGGRERNCYGNSIPEQQQAGNLNSSMEGGGVNLVKFPLMYDEPESGAVLLQTFPDASEVEPNASPAAAIISSRGESVAGDGGGGEVEPSSCVSVSVKEPNSFGLQAAMDGSGEAELSDYQPNPDFQPIPDYQPKLSHGSVGIDDRMPKDAPTSAGREHLFQ